MRPFVRPLAAASLVAYLLVGWLTAGHTHVGHSHDGEAKTTACTTCSCGHHHHHEPAKAEQEKADHGNDAPVPPHDHDGCPVCEFLAQPPLAAQAVGLVAVRGPVLPAVEQAAPAFEPVAPPVSRSRGPPVA
jgi:hypothetical protein